MRRINGLSCVYDSEHDLMLITVLNAPKCDDWIVYEEIDGLHDAHFGYYENDKKHRPVAFNILDYTENRERLQQIFPRFKFPLPEEVPDEIDKEINSPRAKELLDLYETNKSKMQTYLKV